MQTFNDGAVMLEQDPCADYGLPAAFWAVSAPCRIIGRTVPRVIDGGRVATRDEALALAERFAGPLTPDAEQ